MGEYVIFPILALFIAVGVLNLFPRPMAMLALLSRNRFFVDDLASDPKFIFECRMNAAVGIGGPLVFLLVWLATRF